VVAGVVAALIGAAAVAGFAAPARAATPYPAPQGRCVDTAGVLGAGLCGAITQRLLADEQSYAEEIAVAVVPTTGGTAIETWATGLFNHWGVGKRGENNGVLLVVAVTDRTLRIVTGDGARTQLADGAAAELIATSIRPAFAAGHYADGVLAGLDAIRAAFGHRSTGAASLTRFAHLAPGVSPPVDAPANSPEVEIPVRSPGDEFGAPEFGDEQIGAGAIFGTAACCLIAFGGIALLFVLVLVLRVTQGGKAPVSRSTRRPPGTTGTAYLGGTSSSFYDSSSDSSSSWSSGSSDSGSSGGSFGGGDSSGGGSSSSW